MNNNTMMPRICLTIAEGGENHQGMEILGKVPEQGTGFTPMDLIQIELKFQEVGYNTELLDLNKLGEINGADQASVLIVRNVVRESQEMFKELSKDPWDSKYYDRRRQKVLNKRARHNLCYMEGFEQEPDYEHGKGRVIDMTKRVSLHSEYKRVVGIINQVKLFEPQVVEGNYYYDKNTGIGFHGDTERSIVVALSLGGSSTIKWRWFHNSKQIGKDISVTLNDSDLYIMSEKAVGMDWKYRSRITVRHAAGANKYIK